MQEILVQKEPAICDFSPFHVYPPMKWCFHDFSGFGGFWTKIFAKLRSAAKLLLLLNKSACFALAERLLPLRAYTRSPAHVSAHNAPDPPRAASLPYAPPQLDGRTYMLKRSAEHVPSGEHRSPKGD